MKNAFTFGNSKLPKTTAIFNITTASQCPSAALGLCPIVAEGKRRNASHSGMWLCYAFRPEQFRTNVRDHRTFQQAWWDTVTPEQFVTRLRHEAGKRRITALRFNEAGDFRSNADIEKANAIATLLHEQDPSFNVYCYTARRDLDWSNAPSLIVRGSGFNVDDHGNTLDGSFNLLPKGQEYHKAPGTFLCPGSCKTCHACLSNRFSHVFVAEH